MSNITLGVVRFQDWRCTARLQKYADGRPAIALVADDGSPVATATVNVPDIQLDPDEVVIKDWSENQGMLEALIDAGIVHPPHRSVPFGFVVGHVCKLVAS